MAIKGLEQSGFELLHLAAVPSYPVAGLKCTPFKKHPFGLRSPRRHEWHKEFDMYYLGTPGCTKVSVEGMIRFMSLTMVGKLGYGGTQGDYQRPIFLRKVSGEYISGESRCCQVFYEAVFRTAHFMSGGCVSTGTGEGGRGRQTMDAVFGFLSSAYDLEIHQVGVPYEQVFSIENRIGEYIYEWEQENSLDFLPFEGEYDFQNVDRVVFSEEVKQHHYDHSRKLRDSFPKEGVFDVVSVETLPADCTCGHVSVLPTLHHTNCVVMDRCRNEHHQKVTIESAMKENEFSGMYFAPYPLAA